MGRGGLGGLEGRVSGGHHKGVPRVLPLDSLMAIQGSLIPRHHRLEGRAFPVVNYNGADHCPDRAANFARTSRDFVQMREQLSRPLS